MEREQENDPGDPGSATKEQAKSTPETEPTYRVLCISMYRSDIERMDAMVAELKARGMRRANRSWLIRLALSRLELEQITEADRP